MPTMTYVPTIQASTWQAWNQSTYATQTATTAMNNFNTVWTGWTTTGATTYPINYAWQEWQSNTLTMQRPVYSSADLARDDSDRARHLRSIGEQNQLRRSRERIIGQKEAARRAIALLEAVLDEEQAAEFREHKRVTVCTRSGRRYRVRHGWAGNVDELHGDKVVARYCIHPGLACPKEDNMVAQVMMLRTDEESFLRTANRTLVAA